MTLDINEYRFRCNKRTCRTEISIRKNSFFAQSKLPCSKILKLGWLWLNKVPITSICSMIGHGTATVVSFMKFYRQLVEGILDPEDDTIGGEGVVVEIDEAKFGKRK
jgi:hypothetical protein